jgi:hypothetical protein
MHRPSILGINLYNEWRKMGTADGSQQIGQVRAQGLIGIGIGDLVSSIIESYFIVSIGIGYWLRGVVAVRIVKPLTGPRNRVLLPGATER